jgi:cell division inhibitor SulA
MKTVAFDLDEVGCDLKVPTLAAMRTVVPDYPHWERWSNYFHFEQHGISLQQFLEILEEHRVIEEAAPAEFAVEVLGLMREMGYRTAVVTARSWHTNGRKVTEDWIVKHGLPVDDLVLVEMLEPKVEAIRSLGDVVAYVDDLPSHLNQLASAQVGGQLHLMRRPWNAHSFGYRVVRDLNDYARAISREFGVLTKNNNKEQAHAGGVGGQGPGR